MTTVRSDSRKSRPKGILVPESQEITGMTLGID